MPLLNIDLQRLALAVPDEARESFSRLPVRDQLIGLATFAHIANDADVRDSVLTAMETLNRPQYIGLHAARSLIEVCNVMRKMPVDKSPSLMAAYSHTEPQRPTVMQVGQWPRLPEDRFLLEVTSQDMRDVQKQLYPTSTN